MSDLPGKTDFRRVLEWLAALIAAINCIAVPLLFAQPQGQNFPFPGLYFIEIAVLGLIILVFVTLRPRLGSHWNALPWVAAGIILAFVVLGGFSIGPYLIPALIAFVATGVFVDLQTGGFAARRLGYLLVAAVMQGAVMVWMVMID